MRQYKVIEKSTTKISGDISMSYIIQHKLKEYINWVDYYYFIDINDVIDKLNYLRGEEVAYVEERVIDL